LISAAALLAWSALALAVTLSPGPDTLLVASHGARGGLRAGLAALAGIMTAIVIWYGSLIAFGLLSVLVAVPGLFFAVKAVGALYLAYLGVGMVRSAIWGKPHNAPAREPKLGKPFWQGFLTNALNPKVALFYLAALPQFTGGLANAPLVGVMLLAIHAAFGVIWLSFIAYAASRARRIALKSTFVRWLEGGVGVFFVGVAGRLALSQR
jgi:threonine/homoserine/homoserine lactone efflux protein